MKLYDALSTAKTEEDVKDAYVKALGLKGVTKGLVDIRTEEIWFEAKGNPTPSIVMFAQLLDFIRVAQERVLTSIARNKRRAMPKLAQSELYQLQ